MSSQVEKMKLLNSFTKQDLVLAIHKEWFRLITELPTTEVDIKEKKDRLNTINHICINATVTRNTRSL